MIAPIDVKLAAIPILYEIETKSSTINNVIFSNIVLSKACMYKSNFITRLFAGKLLTLSGIR